MTRTQAEARAAQLNANKRPGRSYVAERIEHHGWAVQEYVSGKRGASTYYQ